MHDIEVIKHNLEQIYRRIETATLRAGRNASEIGLLAVTKKQPLEKVLTYLELVRSRGGTPMLGENYVQEYKRKCENFGSHVAHLIGPLQSNKVKEAVSLFEVIESVHSEKVLNLIQKEAEKANKVQKIFLEVNVSNDPAKSGFRLEELSGLVAMSENLTHVNLLGLMTITFNYDHAEEARADFRKLRQTRDCLKFTAPLALSMGMSHDFEIAIEEGADIIRVGTALFGQR